MTKCSHCKDTGWHHYWTAGGAYRATACDRCDAYPRLMDKHR